LISADAFAAYGPARDMLGKFVRRFGSAAILQAVVTTTKLIGLGASIPDKRMRRPWISSVSPSMMDA
jgi:hypothetical protein